MALPLRGDSLGNPEASASIAIENGGINPDRIRRYAASLWATCSQLGIRADVAFAQADLETGMANASGRVVGFRSPRWVKEGNPAGMGITNDKPDSEPGETGSPEWWGQVHAAHLAGYAGIDPGPELREKDFRWQPMIAAGYFGVATTVDDLDERWALDGPQNYGDAIAARWGRYLFPAQERYTPDAGDNEQEDPMAGYQKVRFVGLDRDVYLPDHIKVSIEIVGTDKCGWVRSCQSFSGQTRSTFHDTGSPGSRARSERNYLHSGPRDGSGNRRLVGYNFAVDDTEIIQLTPLNEVTWAAGTPDGNRYGWHVEMCFGGSIDFERSLSNAIALHAGLIAAKGWNPDTALVKHQDWSGKWCPAQILNRGRWPEVQRRVGDGVRAINAGVEPGKPLDIAVGATVATTVNLNIRDRATTSSPIIQTVGAGTELVVIGESKQADGYTWWKIGYEKNDIPGWVAEASTDGTVPYLVVTKPAPDEPEVPEPEYAKPLAIAELAPYVGRPITPMPATIALESGIAVPVFDRVRAIRDTPRRQQVTGDARVGPDIRKGETFDVSFLLIGEGYEPTYLSPWLTRITAADCEVISDAPKDIPAAAPESA